MGAVNLYFSPLGPSCLNTAKSMNTGQIWPWQGHRKVEHTHWAKSFFRGSHVKAQTHVGSHKYNWEQNWVSLAKLPKLLYLSSLAVIWASPWLFYLCHLAEQVTYFRDSAAVRGGMATACRF